MVCNAKSIGKNIHRRAVIEHVTNMIIIGPHHLQTVMPKRRNIHGLPRLYIELDKLHFRIASVIRIPNIERRRELVVTIILVYCHVFRGPPRCHFHGKLASSDVDITAFKSVVR